MSDFNSDFWAIFVTAVTVISIIACILLLLIASKTKSTGSSDNTTGHVWDEDIKELNNPLPKWWVGLFVLTVVFALAYLALYPGLGSYAGTLGWSQASQYSKETETATAKMKPLYARFTAMTPEQLVLDRSAMSIAERLFMNNCSQCHGSDGRGSLGFPNLADADWLYGSSFETVTESIHKGRTGNMPAMAEAIGGGENVRNVSHYVLSLSNSAHNPVWAALGKSKFNTCAACHGPSGQGNPALGAPNLTDNIWLHGWGENAISEIIVKGKSNLMPAQGGRLTAEQIRLLSAYVLDLSNR